MRYQDVRVGMRVRLARTYSHAIAGMEGTVCDDGRSDPGICLDVEPDTARFHECGGRSDNGCGYYIPADCLEELPPLPPPENADSLYGCLWTCPRTTREEIPAGAKESLGSLAKWLLDREGSDEVTGEEYARLESAVMAIWNRVINEHQEVSSFLEELN